VVSLPTRLDLKYPADRPVIQ